MGQNTVKSKYFNQTRSRTSSCRLEPCKLIVLVIASFVALFRLIGRANLHVNAITQRTPLLEDLQTFLINSHVSYADGCKISSLKAPLPLIRGVQNGTCDQYQPCPTLLTSTERSLQLCAEAVHSRTQGSRYIRTSANHGITRSAGTDLYNTDILLSHSRRLPESISQRAKHREEGQSNGKGEELQSRSIIISSAVRPTEERARGLDQRQ